MSPNRYKWANKLKFYKWVKFDEKWTIFKPSKFLATKVLIKYLISRKGTGNFKMRKPWADITLKKWSKWTASIMNPSKSCAIW